MSGGAEWKQALLAIHRKVSSSRHDEEHKQGASHVSSEHSQRSQESKALDFDDDNDGDCELVDPALTAYQTLTPAFKMRPRTDSHSGSSPRFDSRRTERLMEFTSQAWDRLGASSGLGTSTFIHETPFRASRARVHPAQTPEPAGRRAEPKESAATASTITSTKCVDGPSSVPASATQVQATPTSRPKTSPPSTGTSSKIMQHTPPSGARLGDEWKEARLEDGRTYYYNRRTRKSSWSLPAGAIFVRVGDVDKIFVPASPTDDATPAHPQQRQQQHWISSSELRTPAPSKESKRRVVPTSAASEAPPEPRSTASKSAHPEQTTPARRVNNPSRPYTTPVVVHTSEGQQVHLATPEEHEDDEPRRPEAHAEAEDDDHDEEFAAQQDKQNRTRSVGAVKVQQQHHVDLESEEEAVHALETRRQLFTEDSFAITNVYCVFCGLHVPLPDLANHFPNCLVFERIRDTDIHEQLQAALAAGGVVHNRQTAENDGEASWTATEPCPECGRNFAKGRLEKHVKVCKRVFKEKRPMFDATHKRLHGTPMEFYGHTQHRTAHPESPSRLNAKSGTVVTPARSGRENTPNTAPAATTTARPTATPSTAPYTPPRDSIRKMPTHSESPSKPTPISIALLDDADMHSDSDNDSAAVESACPFCGRVLSKAALSSHLLTCRKLKNIREQRGRPTPRKAAAHAKTVVIRRSRTSATINTKKYR